MINQSVEGPSPNLIPSKSDIQGVINTNFHKTCGERQIFLYKNGDWKSTITELNAVKSATAEVCDSRESNIVKNVAGRGSADGRDRRRPLLLHRV